VTNKPWIVVDTNIAVSAFLRSYSVLGRALVKIMDSGELIVSNETLVELLDILLSPKLNRYVPIEIREEFLGRLQLRSLHVNITSTFSVCRDPKDDKFSNLRSTVVPPT
jgi:putative PIN family toxin of toxin-antitoxin system